MFLGHFGVALAAKKVAPRTSLGVLVLAAQFADLLWPIFLLLGWEQVRITPGITRVTPLDFISYPYSHSLLAQLLWGIALGAVYFAIRRDGRGAVIAGLCVPTHWVLDFVAHRPDMPVVPGGERYGLGMWNSLPLTLLVEFVIYGVGIAIYLKTTRAKDRVGVYALWSLLIFLFVTYLGATFGDAPPNGKAIAYMTLAMWLLVPWAGWADKHRDSKAAGSPAFRSE
jgi:hypothetical protein